jgi:hypothetical protein
MASDNEKMRKMLEYSQQMLENTASEMVAIKKMNPGREIADMKEINIIRNQLDQQVVNEGGTPAPRRGRPKQIQEQPVQQAQQPQPIQQQPQVERQSRPGTQYTQQNPYFVNPTANPNQQPIGEQEMNPNYQPEPQTFDSSGLPKRSIPEEDAKKIAQLEQEANIVPSKNFDSFTLPDGSKRKYDYVPLPSNGQCYQHKKSKLPVYYLTAREEDLIYSINLYKSGLLIDSILKSTMADPEINVDDLTQADVDAIILFLRATAYGPEFPVVPTNPKTGEEFKTNISFTDLKYKEFNLIGDEYGWFDYTTGDGDLIKWTIPTRGDERVLAKMITNVEKNIQAFTLNEMADDLRSLVQIGFEEIKQKDVEFLEKTANSLEIIKNKLTNSNAPGFYSDVMTTKMTMITMSVNGEMDRQKVKSYIQNMMAGEAKKYRAYIDNHAPGLDYEIEITIPEDQEGAGETFKTQLSIDDSIFINIVE